ncbi:MAG TPA: ABC transporter permease, partial [Thermoleophilia bacterium]|nr:ABC transporter permease [Thermoleophilia bacterium]
LNDPAALLLVMIGLSAMVSCLGLLLATVFSSEQALVATSVILAMAVSALSGAWFSLDVTGEAFSTVGHMLPTAWVLDALRGIILAGWGVVDVLPAVALCLACAVVFFGIAVWRFSARLAE